METESIFESQLNIVRDSVNAECIINNIFQIKIYQSPFANCQLFTMGAVNRIINSSRPIEQKIDILNEHLLFAYNRWRKPYCLMDLNNNVYNELINDYINKDLIDNKINASVVISIDYLNANDHSMNLVLLNISKIKPISK